MANAHSLQCRQHHVLRLFRRWLDAGRTKWDRFVREGSRVLSRDIITMVLALMVLALSENERMAHGKNCGNIFGLIFELSSAFGTTGHSLGCPGSTLSLSGEFNPFSKLLIILCMLIGRHRGLPRSVDPAVYLPALLGQHGPPVARRVTHCVHDDSASLSHKHGNEEIAVGEVAQPRRELNEQSHRSTHVEETTSENPVHGSSPSLNSAESHRLAELPLRPRSSDKPKTKQVVVVTEI
jgi:hypothetical protein